MVELEKLVRNGEQIIKMASLALDRSLCDHCLGRLFAKAGYGLNNDERGKAVRIMIALSMEIIGKDEKPSDLSTSMNIPVHPSSTITKEVISRRDEDDGWQHSSTPSMQEFLRGDDKDDGCWVCHDVFERVDELASLVSNASNEIEFDTYLIGCRIDPGTTERERQIWELAEPTSAEPIKEELNRSIGKIVAELQPEKDFDRKEPHVVFLVDPLFRTVTIQIKPIFLRSRYRKLIRGIPQTRWICKSCNGKGCSRCNDKGKMYETSVEELIGKECLDASNGTNFKLHGMGREDVDVVTLGRGRPFIIEVSEPKVRELDLKDLSMKVNKYCGGKVEIDDLVYSNRKEVPKIKEGTSKKRYQANITVMGPIDEENLKYNISLLAQSPISQRTPQRVSHRRADKVRKRMVHEISLIKFEGNKARIDLLTDGGLYIKELIHGDDGRTKPSLASLLGTEVVVDSLDVTDVLDDEKDNKDQG